MRKVLIIDNDPTIAGYMAMLVEIGLGFAPVVACSQESALECMAGFEYALIISGPLNSCPILPGEDETECWGWLDYLVTQLRARGSSAPVLLMTSYPQEIFRDYKSHVLQGFIGKTSSKQGVIQEMLKALMLIGGPEFKPPGKRFRFRNLMIQPGGSGSPADSVQFFSNQIALQAS